MSRLMTFRPFPSSRVVLGLPVLLALFAAAPGCAHTHPKYNYAAEPDPRKLEYVLGASDVLKVTVWHNPDLSGDTIVRPDGTITLALVGDLRAAGRTPGQVRAEITQRLSTFLKDDSAIVTVAVTAINSYRFIMGGNVEHPGAYNANHFVTVSEAMTLAGGPNRFSTPEDTVIIRTNATGGTRRIPIDYTAILNGTHPEYDLPLLAGDTVFVP